MGLARKTVMRARFLIPVTVILVAVADLLFYRHALGWPLALYAGLLGGVLFLRHGATLARGPGLLLCAAWVGILFALVNDPGWLAALAALALLLSLRLQGTASWSWDPLAWLARAGRFALRAWPQIPHDAGLARRRRGAPPASAAPPRWLARWWLPLLLTGGFLLLFCVANPVIDAAVRRAWQRVTDLIEAIRFPPASRILFWLLAAVAVWALFRTRGGARDGRRTVPRVVLLQPLPEPPARAALIVRCLALFNALFLVQNVLDLRFLWGGAALPHGMTYAAYAHRGAYPLVATALLAAAFVLIAFRGRAEGAGLALARRLVYLWLAQNVFLTLCALQRLHLYVEAYSLTRLRLAAAIWMGLVAAGLALILWRLGSGRDNRWLLRANSVVLAAVLYVCCFPDLAGFIARYNVAHCREVCGEGPDLDVAYLEHLGPEALPALLQFWQRDPQAPAAIRARGAATRLHAQVSVGLEDWRGWTLERDRLFRTGLRLLPDTREAAVPPAP